jgi:putative transposase
MGAKAVIPPKRNRKVQREYDKDLYKQRNRIERCFSKLKCLRRFATRYENQKPASTPWSPSHALGCT